MANIIRKLRDEWRMKSLRRELSGLSDGQHLVGRQVGRRHFARCRRECAVGTHVAAQAGERDKNFFRIGDPVVMAGIAQRGGTFHQRGQGQGCNFLHSGRCQRGRIGDLIGHGARPGG